MFLPHLRPTSERPSSLVNADQLAGSTPRRPARRVPGRPRPRPAVRAGAGPLGRTAGATRLGCTLRELRRGSRRAAGGERRRRVHPRDAGLSGGHRWRRSRRRSSPRGASSLHGWAALRPVRARPRAERRHVRMAPTTAVKTSCAEDHARPRGRSSRVLARIGRDGRRPAAEVVGRGVPFPEMNIQEKTCWLPMTRLSISFVPCARS